MALKRGRDDIERQVEALARAVQIRADLCDERRQTRRILDAFGLCEIRRHLLDEHGGVVGEGDLDTPLSVVATSTWPSSVSATA